ncbi:protein-disulfide isomerase [Actinobacillus delphinicola]|uniref:Thiol:disulfide interchange protein n=1 Tax=Actinobacillus delphinicola TaxID=51161 RepID=A0A448TS55_9PAST|nr:bifunctional protein-disulfide isomerase/oxidoreductase DsbC [Actinobacillus delphinicola]MDG6897024.1 protein-disulfide isomerase [Actinobacillus delphinicola]VEJ08840.1 DsbG protein [Actinobacillus delphinicola]
MKKLLTLCTLMTLSSVSFASDQPLQQELQRLGLTNAEISASPVPGLKTAMTDMGVFYISQDGKYLLEGKMYKIGSKGIVDLTNQALMSKLNSFSKEMVVFPAAHQKYVINVFLDISCHFCHKMFEQTKAYNDLGITVRYLAFPRNGLDSMTAQQMEAIWRAKDPAYALTQAENNNTYPEKMLIPDIVKKQYDLGIQFGVQGTPTIVMSNGQTIGGYVPPERLLEILKHQ